MESAAFILVTTQNATDGHEMRNVKDVNLCTSFTYTRIANRGAENANLIVMRTLREGYEQDSSDVERNSETGVDS